MIAPVSKAVPIVAGGHKTLGHVQHLGVYGHILAICPCWRHIPGLGAAEVEDDGEPFEDKMERPKEPLEEQFAASVRL